MANQDNIIIIKMVPNITTSILDYFLNIALVAEFTEEDMVAGKVFNAKGKEEYTSLPGVAERFLPTSAVYKVARDMFNQKSNLGINQSNFKKLVVIKKEASDATFEDALKRVGFNNAYYNYIIPKQDSDIESASKWVASQRKILFAQTNSADVLSDATDDIASTLKSKNYGRTALYYHRNADESLAGAVASILSAYPIARKNASYKKPTGITVDELSDPQEGYLNSKNVNHYVAFIGGADDYSTRYLTSENGVVSDGTEIQTVTAIDRTVLSLQAGLMDALEQDIPYDDSGATILYGKVNNVYAQLKKDKIFAEDSVDEETGEMLKSYTINVLPLATVKKHYNEYYAQKMFIIETEVQFAGSGKRIMLTLAY